MCEKALVASCLIPDAGYHVYVHSLNAKCNANIKRFSSKLSHQVME